MTECDANARTEVESCFTNVPDFPIPGFQFPDITPLLGRRPDLFAAIVDRLWETYCEEPPDRIVCVESFGYVFGAPLGYRLCRPLALARRPGKLPRQVLIQAYAMCYSDDRAIEIHTDSIRPGETVIIVDDFLASGGTALAVAQLVRQLNAFVSDVACVVELVDLRGREVLQGHGLNVTSLCDLRYCSTENRWRAISVRI